jgi:hypothetical protein
MNTTENYDLFITNDLPKFVKSNFVFQIFFFFFFSK